MPIAISCPWKRRETTSPSAPESLLMQIKERESRKHLTVRHTDLYEMHLRKQPVKHSDRLEWRFRDKLTQFRGLMCDSSGWSVRLLYSKFGNWTERFPSISLSQTATNNCGLSPEKWQSVGLFFKIQYLLRTLSSSSACGIYSQSWVDCHDMPLTSGLV